MRATARPRGVWPRGNPRGVLLAIARMGDGGDDPEQLRKRLTDQLLKYVKRPTWIVYGEDVKRSPIDKTQILNMRPLLNDLLRDSAG
eukprot:7543346-Pyramimonas_sp.AAC.2